MTNEDKLILADALKGHTIQDLIEAYAVYHPDAVATMQQVQAASDEHASDEINVDSEAFVSPVEGEGVWVMAWVWVPDPDDETEEEDAET